jgi:hypothetical protein
MLTPSDRLVILAFDSALDQKAWLWALLARERQAATRPGYLCQRWVPSGVPASSQRV